MRTIFHSDEVMSLKRKKKNAPPSAWQEAKSKKEPHPRWLPLQLSALPQFLAVSLPLTRTQRQEGKEAGQRRDEEGASSFLFFLSLQQVFKHCRRSEDINVWLQRILIFWFFVGFFSSAMRLAGTCLVYLAVMLPENYYLETLHLKPIVPRRQFIQ